MTDRKTLIILESNRPHFPTNSKIVKILYNVLVQQYLNAVFRIRVKPKICKLYKKNDRENNKINNTENNTKNNNKDNNLVVYALDSETERNLDHVGIKYNRQQLDAEAYASISSQCMGCIKQFPSIDHSISSMLKHRDINLWDLAQFDTWTYLKSRLELLETIKKIIVKENPFRVCVFDCNSESARIINILSDHYGFEVVNYSSSISGRLYKLKQFFSYMVFMFTKPGGIKRISLSARQKPHTITRDFTFFGNYLFPPALITPWIARLGSKFKFISFTKVPQLKNVKELAFESVGDYSDANVREVVKTKSNELRKLWLRLEKDKEFNSKLKYHDIEYNIENKKPSHQKATKPKEISIFPLLSELVHYYLTYYFVELVKYIELSRNVFRVEKPKLNISFDEISTVSKTINYAANSSGVPTLLVQHGMIGGIPVYGGFHADLFAVYGNNSKQVYKNWGVEENKIRIIGNIKFDSIFHKRKNYVRANTLSKLNIQPSKKIILFTSHLMEKDERDMHLTAIFNSLNELSPEEYHLIIKLHPSEDGRIHANMARKFSKYDNYTIIKDADTFELLSACDVLITFYSTTGLEAMIFSKPVIILNLSGKPDRVPYVKNGAAIGVYAKEDLTSTILHSINDNKLRSSLFTHQSKYVSEEAFKVDGKVADRLIALIDELIKGRT